jgi:hypothetical protein
LADAQLLFYRQRAAIPRGAQAGQPADVGVQVVAAPVDDAAGRAGAHLGVGPHDFQPDALPFQAGEVELRQVYGLRRWKRLLIPGESGAPIGDVDVRAASPLTSAAGLYAALVLSDQDRSSAG